MNWNVCMCVSKCLRLYLYCILWTNICNSVDDIVFERLIVVRVAGDDLRTNFPFRVCCPERLLVGLPNRYHSLHPYGFSRNFGRVVSPTSPQTGLSNRLRSYTYGFHGSPSARLTDLQFSYYYFSCLYMCLCGTNIFFRYPFGLWLMALRAHRPYGLSNAHSSKGGALRTSGSLLCSVEKRA